ncbi:MAG TPA: VOC family protein [Acidimicrobiales bacterium]
MTTRDRAPVGAPVWIDLMTTDTDRARSFYGELFGWDCDEGDAEFGGYANFTRDGEQIAGLMGAMPDAQPDVWSVYLAVDDAAATVAAAEAEGAPVYVPPMQVGDYGTMAVIADPGGAAVGMWQPDTHVGITTLAEPGAPHWFELHTRSYEPSLDFYRKVFGWDTHTASDEELFRYTTLGEGEGQLAGVMDNSNDLPEGTPGFWVVYINVTSADATVEKLVALGGSVVHPAEDTPYGRLAAVTDPMGAAFSLCQP